MATLNTMPLRLGLEDSRLLLAKLEAQELPWELLYQGEGIFAVFIDGSETVHQLDLNSPGGWCMRTHIEI